jgi:hypothetical protein
LISPPLALAFSTGSVLNGDRKWYTIVTLLVSGAITLVIAWSFFAH